jgi:potassium/hydrogen antiporter
MLDAMNLAILLGAGLVAVSIFTSVLASRLGAPLLLLFLGLGLLVGEDGLGLEFDNAPLAYFVGSLALAVILFDSGFATRLRTIRAVAGPAPVLATVGVVLTTVLAAAAARVLFGFGWLQALLMGAIVGSTDAAAVFFLLRAGGITIRERVRATLEIESGSNDPMAIFLTATLVGLLAGQAAEDSVGWVFAQSFALQLGLGALLGIAGGLVIVQAVDRIELERGLYPLVALGLGLFLFAVTNMLGGSGFLAVYLAGLLAGNAELRPAAALRRFQDGMTWLAQIAMFLTLGLLATPSTFLDVLVPAAALGLFLAFVARPVAVWLCLLPFGFTRNETAFVAWVGLRGAVSILLAILPLMEGLPRAQAMFNATFLVVLVSLVLQGWTLRWAARRLELLVPPRHGPLERVELELPGSVHHELVVYHIVKESPVARGARLPRWARPSLVVREGRRLDVHGAGRLRPDDYVYIFTTPRQVALLDRLFASPAELNLDDRELFGDFVLSAGASLAEIGHAYGVEPAEGDGDLSVGERLAREFGEEVGPGDRLAYGPIDLVVRTLADDGRIETVGLRLAPARLLRERVPQRRALQRLVTALRGEPRAGAVPNGGRGRPAGGSRTGAAADGDVG